MFCHESGSNKIIVSNMQYDIDRHFKILTNFYYWNWWWYKDIPFIIFLKKLRFEPKIRSSGVDTNSSRCCYYVLSSESQAVGRDALSVRVGGRQRRTLTDVVTMCGVS